jgi:hypothetical protein
LIFPYHPLVEVATTVGGSIFVSDIVPVHVEDVVVVVVVDVELLESDPCIVK